MSRICTARELAWRWALLRIYGLRLASPARAPDVALRLMLTRWAGLLPAGQIAPGIGIVRGHEQGLRVLGGEGVQLAK